MDLKNFERRIQALVAKDIVLEGEAARSAAHNDAVLTKYANVVQCFDKQSKDLQEAIVLNDELIATVDKWKKIKILQKKEILDVKRQIRSMKKLNRKISMKMVNKKGEPTKLDNHIVNKTNYKCNLFKTVTGLSFQFNSPNKLRGFYRNDQLTSINCYDINSNEKSNEEVSDEIWSLIRKKSIFQNKWRSLFNHTDNVEMNIISSSNM